MLSGALYDDPFSGFPQMDYDKSTGEITAVLVSFENVPIL